MEINKLNAKRCSKFGQSGAIFGIALFEAIKEHPDIVILSADMSTPAGLDKFKNTVPENFYNLGIAEQNMTGTAAGFASEGYCPVTVAQACFISMRSFEQIRQYCGYMNFPIISVGINAGFALTYLGNTHYAVEDIGILRTVPELIILSPSDAWQAAKAFLAAVALKKPVYMRLTGTLNTPVIYESDFNFEIGKAIRIKEGDDIQIIATGNIVKNVLIAAELLENDGISTEVIDMHTIKPLDKACISMQSKLIITVEEHSIINGLGGAVAEYLSSMPNSPKLMKLGVNDTFSKVGDYSYLLEQHGLTPESIRKSIKEEL
ncbi:MAG: transketolase [Prevotellaceae bacterium]|jgi:transketolase|nr:transketolase [Prevotellaceae bacterium]